MKKQKDGRYRTTVTVGHDPDGRAIIKYASGRTQKELKDNIDELKRKYINGSFEVERNVMFEVFCLEWFDTAKKDWRPSGRQSYASTLNKHILPAFRGRQLRSISRKDLQDFISSKSGMKPSSLGNMMFILRRVFGLAAADGIIDRDPTLEVQQPSAKKSSRRALTELETEAVIAVADKHPEGLLLKLLYFTGARIGEVLGLQWGDVDFESKTISIKRDIDFHDGGNIGEVKTESSIRRIPMPTQLLEALNAVRGIGDTFLIQAPGTGKSLCESTYKRRWARLMQAVAEEAVQIIQRQREEKNIGKIITISPMIETKTRNPSAAPANQKQMSILTPHYFRHNYATILYDADVDLLSAQRFLGHSDIKTTLAIYSHLSKEKETKKSESVRQAFDAIYKVAKKLPEELKAELLTE